MRAFTLGALLSAALLAVSAVPCSGQTIYRTPINDGARYNVYYPNAYPGSTFPGYYNRSYYTVPGPKFTTRGYYNPIPFGSSWYSNYYFDAPVYNGPNSYNYTPYYGP